MNSGVDTDSVRFAIGELRKIEDERVADERAARARHAEAIAEAVHAAERGAEAERARADAERTARELAEKVARIQADAEVERERHAAERARLEVAALAARPAPRGLTPVWAALALGVVMMLGAALWLDRRIDEQRARAAADLASLRIDLGARADEAVRRADHARQLAVDAAARPPAITPVSPPPAPAPPSPRRPPPRTGGATPARAPATTITPVDPTNPLGGLHR